MPNPFPGMDPYLEGDLWTSVHTDLCAEIARQLAPKLRPKYAVLSTRRVLLTPPDESLPEPIPHVGIEIRDVAQRRLLTCIEVLSPSNKHGPGLEEYAGKRFQILSGAAHLVEIDLLRIGQRFLTGQRLPAVPYFVFISHAERRQEVEVWPIALDQPLPVVPIPLLPEDSPVPLDLQQALSVVYNILGYDELVDYSKPPLGLLTPTQTGWVDEQLRRSGRRK